MKWFKQMKQTTAWNLLSGRRASFSDTDAPLLIVNKGPITDAGGGSLPCRCFICFIKDGGLWSPHVVWCSDEAKRHHRQCKTVRAVWFTPLTFLYYHYVAVLFCYLWYLTMPLSVFSCLCTCTQLLLFMFSLVYFVGLCYSNLGSKPEDTFNLVRCLGFSAIWVFFPLSSYCCHDLLSNRQKRVTGFTLWSFKYQTSADPKGPPLDRSYMNVFSYISSLKQSI